MYSDNTGKLFVISGPSGVGKGTLVRRLLNDYPEIVLSTSVTTRPPRQGEIEGFHYFFVEKNVFLERLNNGYFIEWTEFAGNYYGTDRNIVDSAINQGVNLLLEIDVKGALRLKETKPDAVLIFIEPPSIEELKTRLFKRKTESEDEIRKRLDIVKSEVAKKDKFNYCIVNDILENSYQKLESIITAEMNKTKNCPK